MNLKIIEDKENKLLNRKEILADIEFSGKTPTNNEVKKELAKNFKVDEKLVIIDKIDQEFGANKAKVYAKIYKSEKDIEKIEFIEEVKEKTEINKEEIKMNEEEKPKEEPKEEPEEEEKKEEEEKEEKEEDKEDEEEKKEEPEEKEEEKTE